MCGICGCEKPHQLLTLHQSLLSRNNHQAEHNRAHFHHHGLLAVNLLSAPGSGKTALLEQLARHWSQRPVGVIVGDLATDTADISLVLFSALSRQGLGDAALVLRQLVTSLYQMVTILLLTVQNFNSFIIPWIMTGGGPAGATDIWITQVYQLAFGRQRWGVAAAYSVILFVIVLSISLIQRWLTREKS